MPTTQVIDYGDVAGLASGAWKPAVSTSTVVRWQRRSWAASVRSA